ncbi:MAG: hypothetical protein JW856_01860 [Dehalococcoidales bacterium]|nr:hypothetical protein [Dehalococcoidales bacterium]
MAGVRRLKWARLYEGTEYDCHHGLCIAGDGSLIRVRLTMPSDDGKLYRQRVAEPGSQSDFSVWSYTGQNNCLAVAVAACGAEVAVFWVNNSRELRRIKSNDYGASWSSPELLDYTPSIDVRGVTASYKPNGDAAVFFIDQTALYVKECIGGVWQAKSVWDKNTGELSSVAVVYDSDWNLLVTGQDPDGNCKLWSLIYGNSAPGSWSDMKELASAPAGGEFEYRGVFLSHPDVYRAFYVEKFRGTQDYERPFWTYSVPETDFIDNLWHEPVPFDFSCEYGLAIAHYGDYCWLSTANSVWRAELSATVIDITADVLSVKYESVPDSGRLVVELRNDDGRYHSPEEIGLSIGSQIEFSPGYVTSQGKESSPGPAFWLDGREYISAGGKSSLALYGIDGWGLLEDWRARHQFRWNKDAEEMSVGQILGFVLARAGLKLEVKSKSSVIDNFYPDFTIHPDDRGISIVGRLLSFVPDLLFIEGVFACLVHPQSSDEAVYSYGQAHSILQGRYRTGGWKTNRVCVEGHNDVSGEPVIVDSFTWEEMEHFYNRTQRIVDRNIGTVSAGQARGGAYLRKMDIDSFSGSITVPVNCGQQLYDVIDITDTKAGLSAAGGRVMGITLDYRPDRGEYEQRLLLGGV